METITKERKLKIVITLLTITLITCIFLWITSQRNHRIEVDKLKTENARQLAGMYFLYDELFKEKNENGRHELTREEFFTNHPNLKKEYEHYYEHETE
jgi:uncharacterized membrane protein YkgB